MTRGNPRAVPPQFKPKGHGEFVGGHYKPPPLPEFYCKECDLEFRSGDVLAHHRELRHEER